MWVFSMRFWGGREKRRTGGRAVLRWHGSCWGKDMNSTFFHMKQAHLSALRVSRKTTLPIGLTPARLDMLRAILERCGQVLQLKLKHLLGVSNPVISIMVRALERLGLVTRDKCRTDRRTFVVSLTKAARYALRRVFFELHTEGFEALTFASAFGNEWLHVTSDLCSPLARFREAFGIGLTHHDPWEWNDDDEPFYYAAVRPNPVRIGIVPTEDELDEQGNLVEEDDIDPPAWLH